MEAATTTEGSALKRFLAEDHGRGFVITPAVRPLTASDIATKRRQPRVHRRRDPRRPTLLGPRRPMTFDEALGSLL